VIAIAHIRGGGKWGASGMRMANFYKITPSPICIVAEHLIAQKWTSSDRLVISGVGSGLLIGQRSICV